MEKNIKQILSVLRRKKLKEEYPDGKAIGIALIQFYLDRKRKRREPDFTPILTFSEIEFLKNTISNDPIAQSMFEPYSTLEQILRHNTHWIEHYEHIYYHGLFRDLSVIQTPDYDMRIYHLLLSQSNIDEQEIKKAKKQYIQTLIPIVTILMPNWRGMMAYPLKKLYKYSFRLEKIQELTGFDLSYLMPDMKHHEVEVRELQRIARVFMNNIESFITSDNIEISEETIKCLDDFINIDIDSIKLNDQEKERCIKKVLETMSLMEGATVK